MAPVAECQFCHTPEVSLEAQQASERLQRMAPEQLERVETSFGFVPRVLCATDFLLVLQHANTAA